MAEIILPDPGNLQLSPAGPEAMNRKVRRIISFTATSAFFGLLLWAINQFTSFRGVVNMTASRIVLAFGVLVGVLFTLACVQIFIEWSSLSRKTKWWSFSISLLLWIVVAVLADRFAPKPAQFSDLTHEYLSAISWYINVQPDLPYAEGTLIAGIPWKTGSILSQLRIAPKKKLFNVELAMDFDCYVVHAGQISNVPNVILTPKDTQYIKQWQGWEIDKNGQRKNWVSSTPEDMQAANGFFTRSFVFHETEMTPDLPINLAFIGGPGYHLGNFMMLAPRAAFAPHQLHITGKYDIEYEGKMFTVPVDKELKEDRTKR